METEILNIDPELTEALDRVKDPEIPRVSVLDLGIILEARKTDEGVKVKMTPTFSGCPAVEIIKEGIEQELGKLNLGTVDVEVSFDEPWSSNRITERGRQLLKESGFALPGKHAGNIEIEMFSHVECPFCSSKETVFQTPFGPTLCRAIHYCKNCRQSFEQFKPV